ncbi:MAG TPA: transposase [Steroidobacteraceae bacterium]|nr:transposase [Steroidobacteraceae bacterium]
MPRTSRAIVGNYCYHVINRGNQKARVFHEPADYEQFLALLARAQQRLELPLISACLMPNHFHLVVRPCDGDDLARWMHWAFTTHVRWYHEKYDTTGRVWQGRFKAFAAQEDHHLLSVMRYVERNALRANLVERAEDWEWSSLAWRREARPRLRLAQSPVSLPSYWRHYVNEPHTSVELAELRACVNRQRPFGEEDWVKRQIKEFGLESSITPPGRPRKSSPVPVS